MCSLTPTAVIVSGGETRTRFPPSGRDAPDAVPVPRTSSPTAARTASSQAPTRVSGRNGRPGRRGLVTSGESGTRPRTVGAGVRAKNQQLGKNPPGAGGGGPGG